jgi:hypothetical protein
MKTEGNCRKMIVILRKLERFLMKTRSKSWRISLLSVSLSCIIRISSKKLPQNHHFPIKETCHSSSPSHLLINQLFNSTKKKPWTISVVELPRQFTTSAMKLHGFVFFISPIFTLHFLLQLDSLRTTATWELKSFSNPSIIRPLSSA